MTIEKPGLLARIFRRFDVRIGSAQIPPLVLMTTNFDELLKEYNCFREDNIARLGATGVGNEVFLTVDEGKRYGIMALKITRTGGGDGTISTLEVGDRSGSNYAIVDSQATAPNMNVEFDDMGLVLTMDEFMNLRFTVSVITTNTEWTIRWYGYKEDAF